MTRYRNPWARPYEPQFYETAATPVLYAGCEIYRHAEAFDVVKAGACISQRCTLIGAKMVADLVTDLLCPTPDDVHSRMMDRYDCL